VRKPRSLPSLISALSLLRRASKSPAARRHALERLLQGLLLRRRSWPLPGVIFSATGLPRRPCRRPPRHRVAASAASPALRSSLRLAAGLPSPVQPAPWRQPERQLPAGGLAGAGRAGATCACRRLLRRLRRALRRLGCAASSRRQAPSPSPGAGFFAARLPGHLVCHPFTCLKLHCHRYAQGASGAVVECRPPFQLPCAVHTGFRCGVCTDKGQSPRSVRRRLAKHCRERLSESCPDARARRAAMSGTARPGRPCCAERELYQPSRFTPFLTGQSGRRAPRSRCSIRRARRSESSRILASASGRAAAVLPAVPVRRSGAAVRAWQMHRQLQAGGIRSASATSSRVAAPGLLGEVAIGEQFPAATAGHARRAEPPANLDHLRSTGDSPSANSAAIAPSNSLAGPERRAAAAGCAASGRGFRTCGRFLRGQAPRSRRHGLMPTGSLPGPGLRATPASSLSNCMRSAPAGIDETSGWIRQQRRAASRWPGLALDSERMNQRDSGSALSSSVAKASARAT